MKKKFLRTNPTSQLLPLPVSSVFISTHLLQPSTAPFTNTEESPSSNVFAERSPFRFYMDKQKYEVLLYREYATSAIPDTVWWPTLTSSHISPQTSPCKK